MSALGFYKRLREAGVDEATAMLCAEEFDKELQVAVNAVLEPRRAKDRARKAGKAPRNSAETTESAASAESSETLSLPLPPQTPPTPTHTRVSINTREDGRESAAFDRFWAAYPRKVSKADARKAFGKAWRKLPPYDEEATLIGGLERAKAGWVDAQFIPHAATWLTGERWNDEAAPIIELHPQGSRNVQRHPNQANPSPREDRLGRMLSGAMAAADRYDDELDGRRAGSGNG